MMLVNPVVEGNLEFKCTSNCFCVRRGILHPLIRERIYVPKAQLESWKIELYYLNGKNRTDAHLTRFSTTGESLNR